jgi:hypothetical protein
MKNDWERLKLVLWQKDVNANALAKKLGRSVQTFYDIKSKPNVGISVNLAEAISSLYPDISEAWLLTGKGDMMIDNGSPVSSAVQEEANLLDSKVTIAMQAKWIDELRRENKELAQSEAVLRYKLSLFENAKNKEGGEIK